ncbi:zinc-dependent metalloprotease [Flavivirga rizhaonensis]|uniref:T9SS type A sorting domain-containing protein n=1 Tax=Flavivirga rizhaonensis TaxID=2559571 RepID=A0A4S1DW96_9FLAO|nr:GEVED domain-containing protein [Flavivirga rizhaonensis]TGV01768.1 T9SS type A sorting domain-containing protein [Flavivirga rizhaonensis]
MKTKLHYVFSITMLLFAFSAIAQNSSWKQVENLKNPEKLSKFHLDKNQVHLFELDIKSFKKSTASTTLRSAKNKKETIISLPGINGQIESFKIYEAPVFSPELASKYPNIKSYVGISINNSGTRLRMSMSPQGVQTMISYVNNSNVFMQPLTKGSNKYVVYDKRSKNSFADKFECKTLDKLNKSFNKSTETAKVNEGGANNQTLQKFRIAISTTSEYTAYHDDGNAGNGDAIADALAAINTTLGRVNEIFETDMGVTFELVNATQLIYNNAATDPYSDASEGTSNDNSNNTNGWSLQLQNTLTTELGNAAYDIGHLLGATGGGGNAGCIGCVCRNDNAGNSLDKNKGSGYTSPSNSTPEGDTFDLDFVAHEIGHQMGANHTWAFESEGTGVNSEPGSGSTIMGYAGIEGANNVELNGDDYFHYHSIKQILDNLSTKSCQTTEAISNNPPSADAGNNYNIPKGTAYVLNGAATDLDGGDNLTYCWEQIDDGISNFQNFGSTLTSGSMNRSLPPSNSPDRYIPKFASVIAGNTIQTAPTLGSDWETVSTVARTLNWALTVRDRAPIASTGGQSSFDTMQIIVEDVTPFTMTNPVSWAQGSMQTIEWEIGQTTNATINCQNVNIKLSTDGGVTFPITIASNTPNDGSFDYTVPAIPDTSAARLLIEAADNIFYDVSNFNFSISPTPSFFIVEETLNPIDCGATTATFNFDYVTANGFSENTVFSVSGNPAGSTVTFLPTNLSDSGTVTMTINDLDGIAQADYPLIITGTSTSITKNNNVTFPFFNGICSSAGNTTYNTSTTLVQFNTINNASAKPSGYSDYTSIITDLNRNISYDLTVNVNTDGDFITATKVWIDWNQNCSFNDAGEEYDLGDASNIANGATANSPISITVPLNAVPGNTTMRVSTKFKDDGLPTSCDNGFDGEVEDYTINILPDDFEYDTSITLVQFNTINQISEKPSSYSDFSSIITEVNRDSSYDLTVNVNTEGNFTTATKVWMDWNQNSSFDDPGEAYDLGDATNVSNEATNNSPLSISIPIDAVLGNTIMRIATRYIGDSGNQEPIPSENGFDGEVEDYTITIIPTLAIEESGYDNLIIYPNANNGKFNVKLNGALNRGITVEVFDARGQFIYKNIFEGTGDFNQSIDLNNVQSGLYILRINDGLRESTKKIIIK